MFDLFCCRCIMFKQVANHKFNHVIHGCFLLRVALIEDTTLKHMGKWQITHSARYIKLIDDYMKSYDTKFQNGDDFIINIIRHKTPVNI